jgi:hypothetical protein
MSLNRRHTKTRVFNDRWGTHGHKEMRQPLLENEEYSCGYASVRHQKALEDIARRIPWIEYMVSISAGCALGNLLGMFTACVYYHVLGQNGGIAPV